MSNLEEFSESVFSDVLRQGVAVRWVRDMSPPLAFTIGRALNGHPELMISSALVGADATEVINRAMEMDEQEPLEVGSIVAGLIAGALVKISEVTGVDVSILTLIRHQFPEAKLFQLIWSDAAGRFPGDVGCEILAEAQVVYQ